VRRQFHYHDECWTGWLESDTGSTYAYSGTITHAHTRAQFSHMEPNHQSLTCANGA